MPGVGNGPVSTSKPRVLIVDDERPFGRVLKLGLGKQPAGENRFDVVWDLDCPRCEGLGCMSCVDERGKQTGRVPYGQVPRKALELLCGPELFDLTFLDIVMPDLNGMSFFANLRLRAAARCNRIVFMTGGGQIPAIEDFIAKHHTIEKPASLEELESCVDAYSRLTRSRGPR